MNILKEEDFLREHAMHFYQKYPTAQHLRDELNERITYKVNNSPARVDTDFFESNREKFVDTIVAHLHENKGYLHFLRMYFLKKLNVNTNELHKAMKKMGKGVKIIPAEKSKNGMTQFESYGADQGRAIINNLSYKEIASCKKGKSVDVLTWDALNDVTSMKHCMRPAYWKNIVNGDFDLSTLQASRERHYDILIKLISLFADRASVFRSGVYAAIINHYAPFAERSLHLVGSWNTPTLAASALLKLKHQVIIDVIPRQKEVGQFIYNNFIPGSLTNPKHKYDFIICPSEQLDIRLGFSEKYNNYFDVQMFSPVYFTTEEYNTVDGDAGEQSIDSFPTYESWIEGYFHQTIKTAYRAMKPGSKFIIVISDFEYQDKTTKKWYYISKDMLTITANYFKHIETADLILTRGSGFTNKSQKDKRRESRKNLFSEHIHVLTKDEEYFESMQETRDNFVISNNSMTPTLIPDEIEETDEEIEEQLNSTEENED